MTIFFGSHSTFGRPLNSLAQARPPAVNRAGRNDRKRRLTIRGVPFVTFAMLAACFACARQTPMQSGATSVIEKSEPNQPCDLGTKVRYLADSSFHPDWYAALPPESSFPPGSPDYARTLTEVFKIASVDFKKTLCRLNVIYITPTPNSWGWMYRPTGWRAVALSTGLWHKETYSGYETDLTRSVLPKSEFTYTNAEPNDNLVMAVLAALAHEVGHIAWYAEVPAHRPADFCGGNFFISWKANTVSPPPHWRELLTPSERDRIRHSEKWSSLHGRWPYLHSRTPNVDSIDASRTKGAEQLAYEWVSPGAPWASPFAAISPDEDFVETYKFKVLTTANPPLSSVQITVPGAETADIVRDYRVGNRRELKQKVDCISVDF
jgi:hypothetical protein